MAAELIVTAIVIALYDRVLDRPIHTLDLSIGPWMVRFGEPVFDPQPSLDFATLQPSWE